MSNKLKTLSETQLETFISEKVGEYLNEECTCDVNVLSTPNIDSESHIALHDDREISFNVHLSYKDTS